ncbi:hypothetical protein AGMMS49521_3090 [Campylobacterota bacterium]|nr:hypothetical protein AGMMS49521_3090 [Campylobacterota bacterium]GHV05651.1 hypothetical protein AGMMS50229_09080 [Campylobacterota bacterium]
MRPEAKVGLFVIVSFIALFALSTRVSTVANFGKDGYRLIADVPSAVGLEVNSRVSVQGVKAGFLEKAEIQKGKVRLTLFIDHDFEINSDAIMLIVQESLLGGNSINIFLGSSEKMLVDGDRLVNVKKHASIDEAVDEIKEFAAKLNNLFDDDTQSDLRSALSSLKAMGENLAAAGEEFRIAGATINERLPKIVAQIDALSAEFNQTGSDINKRLPYILDRFAQIEDDVAELIAENKKPLNETIESVRTFFDKGSDTLASLDQMLNKVDKAEVQFDLGYNQLFNDELGESYASVAYLPNPTNYYMLGVTSASKINEVGSDGEVILPGKHDDNGKYFISAQLGKRYDDFLVRGGLIRSTGGGGIDYFADHDRLKLSLDVYDFNAINDIRGSNAHARFTARYLGWHFITFYAGYDNFLNRNADNFFAGAGVHFVDDDLKYLLISGMGAIK